MEEKKPIFIVLDISKYGTPEIIDYFYTEDEAIKLVAERKSLWYAETVYEILYLTKEGR